MYTPHFTGRFVHRKTFALLVLGLVLLLTDRTVGADERDAAETRLAEVKREIEALQRDLEQDRGALSREREALKSLDFEIQDTVRTLEDVTADLATQEAEVDRVRAERDAFIEQLDDRQDELGQQVLAAWKMSRESRLKLVLNQDDPARLGRMLAYYEYFGEAQAERIHTLREALAGLATVQDELDAELRALAGIQDEHERRRANLESQRDERLTLVAGLEEGLASDQARLEELARNQRDLETLIERLGDALADIPADLGSRRHPVDLRGQLPMPVDGRVLEAYGRPRAAGLAWQGWLIEAASGTPVRAVAYGRVAYADWLRGYGLLMILDHGDGFMSLYGHNESLRAEVGEWVEPGEAISSVGQGPERRQGLYFELRRNGKAIDPAGWLRR